MTYVGQTKRPFYIIRKQEHIKNVDRRSEYHGVITKHLKENNDENISHFIKWDEFEILHSEPNVAKRLVAEMFFIKKEGKNSLNKMTDLERFDKSYEMILNFISNN